MAIIFPRQTYSNETLQSQVVVVPANGKAYDLECDPTNFLDPAQGLRTEIIQSTDGGTTWTVVTSNPVITEADPDPYIPGGLDRLGNQRRAGLYGLTGVAGSQVFAMIVIRGSVNMRVLGTVSTG